MHARSSRMAIDPRVPTMPGRSMSGFHRPGRRCLHQARASSYYVQIACEADFPAYGWQRPTNRLVFGVATSRDSNGYTTQRPRGCLTIYTQCVIRSFPSCGVTQPFPLGGGKLLHPPKKNWPDRQPWWPPKKNKQKNGTHWCRSLFSEILHLKNGNYTSGQTGTLESIRSKNRMKKRTHEDCNEISFFFFFWSTRSFFGTLVTPKRLLHLRTE